jgi:hypothetical protein
MYDADVAVTADVFFSFIPFSRLGDGAATIHRSGDTNFSESMMTAQGLLSFVNTTVDVLSEKCY